MAIVLALGYVLALSGCAQRTTDLPRSPTSRDKITDRALRIALPYHFRSLNPLFNDGFNAGMLDALVFSLLANTDRGGRLVPEAALAIPSVRNGGIAPDGRTITYHLRRDLRWSDGEPLTAKDVVFTVRAIVDPRNDVGSRTPYSRLSSVVAVDRFTVRLRLAKRDASIVGLFFTDDSNYPILPAHLLGAVRDLNTASYNALPIGSGPYRITRWDRGNAIELAANARYFGGKPSLARIELRDVPDTTTELLELRTGELDAIVNADPALADRLRAVPGHRITNVPYAGATLLMFQTTRPIVADPRVRRAIAASIDRDRLAALAYHGLVSTTDALRGVFSYDASPSVRQQTYDPERAARLFDEAGWRRGPSGLRERGGQKLELTLIYYATSVALRLQASVIEQDLARAGASVALKSYAYSQFWLRASDGGALANGRFDLALTGISTNVDPDVSWLLRCRESAPAGFNQMRYCNREVDAALDDALGALDPPARARAVERVERIVARDVPILALWQTRELDVVPDDLLGFVPNGTYPFASAGAWSRSH